MRKLFGRLFKICLVLLGLTIAASAIAGYMAAQPPAFYAQWRAKTLSADECAAAKRQFEQAQLAVQRWLDQSLARQQAKFGPASGPGLFLKAFAAGYDPRRDVHTFRITEQQLNALLYSQSMGRRDPMRHPRGAISADRIELGVEVGDDNASAVLSITLRPSLTPEGNLRLDVCAARVGVLALPLSTILRCLPNSVVHSGHDAEIDLNPRDPHVTLKFAPRSRPSPTVKSIECKPGEIVVQLLPPVLESAAAAGKQ